jgi:hypothetical protein
MNNYLENPVFICGHRKGGTTMLINMLDNASDAIVYPDDSSFFYMYYPRFESDDYTKEEKVTRVSDIIIGDVLKRGVENLNIADEDKKSLLDKVELLKGDVRAKLEEKNDFSYKVVLQVVMDSLRENFYPNNNPKVWIEKTTSTELYALDMVKLFPNAKFVHITRDPRDNWASLKSGWKAKYKDVNDDPRRLLQSLLDRGKLGLEFAKYNQEVIGRDKYLVVRYEDFTSNPEHFMKIISSFIGIEYDENLLKPTTFGFEWEGNNFDGLKFKSASNKNVGRWKDRITEEEAMLIEFHCKDIMDYFDYKREFNIADTLNAAKEHYKWFNFAQQFSAK